MIGISLAGIIVAGGITATAFIGAFASRGHRQSVPFHTLLWGVDIGGFSEPTYLVVNNQSAWSLVWTRAFWVKDCPTPYPPLNCPPIPEVNFTTTTVIAVFRGMVGYGAMTINVTQVSTSGSDLFVKVQLTDPDWNHCNAVEWSVYPFHIVTIPRTEAHATFTTVNAKRCG